MAKYFGIIGFAVVEETAVDVWEETITKRPYYGDILQNYRRLENSGGVNDTVTITNQFSILADPFAQENFHAIRYITYMGTKWKATSVEVQYPRLIINVGGIYNDGEDESESESDF